ncbi:hypothetical protein PV367_31375 [Streptomyces europaeiscabiei]|uniref:Uncharacterized protein n=1 Tax=Streptomyces europaeiscabiei TaxID=146819 RepID=A0AAJ2UP22_9ACTN|nr:hypothetical protein [Streptomyces europaeiscabiei]MDX3134188.1 hypothetical protein [Streptomyces europaeiscabiei]
MVVALLTLGVLLFAALVVVTSPVVPIVGWWADAARSPWPGSVGVAAGVGVGDSQPHGDSSSCGSGGGSSCGGGSSSSCGSGG